MPLGPATSANRPLLALVRPGRCTQVAGNLRVKEVHVAPGGKGDGDGGMRAQPFVVCHNRDQAHHDAQVRANLVEHLKSLIDRSDDWTRTPTATGFRTYGKSKDHREDLPQVVIGMAVTRTGIPVRVWSWPGNTADSALIRQVTDDMARWNLGKVVWVADRGFTSAENRRYLQRAGGGYILGEKLRSGSAEATAALSRQARYQEVTGTLRVEEVRLGDGDRFVIAHNPDQAIRDAAIRAELVARLQEMIAGTDKLAVTKRAQLRGVISTKPGLNRYLRVTAGGLLRVDRAAITAEAKLDGKYLLRTNEPTLSAEDLALGYKQLLGLCQAS